MNALPRSVRGHTLAEMLIAMTIMAVIGAALTRLIVIQSRAFRKQTSYKEARAVTRAALNLMQSELRMVEVTGGMLSATPEGIGVRVPYAIGVICNTTTISILPLDSLMYANAVLGGYAWRDSVGAYTYVESSPTVGAGTVSNCTAVNIATLTGGQVLAISPALPATARVGDNVMLYQRIRYSFGASGLLPGRYGLFRTVGSGTPEEIAMPFDSATTRFKFFNVTSDTSRAVVTTADIRGVELNLTGQSERIPSGLSSYATSQLITAVFFGNRAN